MTPPCAQPGPTPEDALPLAEHLIGRRPQHLAPFLPTAGGDDSHSFRLWDRGRPLLLKVMVRPGIPVGAYFHGRLREAGVPVPELVAFSTDGGPRGAACGMFEWVDGVPAEFSSHERPPYDEAEFGSLLHAIHGLRHEGGFGRLDDAGQTTHARWIEWICQFVDWGAAACLRCDALDQRLADELRTLPEQFADVLAAAPAALLHYGDIMHNGNVIVDPDSKRIRAVVDFSDAIVGDPGLELAWMDLYFGEHGYFGRGFDLMRFRHAYGDDGDASDPTRLFYVCLALMTMLTYVDPTSERGRHHQKLLRRIASGLVGPWVDRTAPDSSRTSVKGR